MTSFSRPKTAEAQKLQEDVEQFLAAGGEIKQFEFGLLAEDYSRPRSSKLKMFAFSSKQMK